MSTGTIIAIVVVVAVLALAAVFLVPLLRRRRLQRTFGPEYQRVVETQENRAAAERDLREREKRHASLEIRSLPTVARQQYSARWVQLQERFVDNPEAAVIEADRLVTAVMADRGYPTEGYQQQLADLSVEHAGTLDHYRAAHDTQQHVGRGEVSTEDLRVALMHYRSVFVELLGPESHTDGNGRSQSDRTPRQDAAH